MEVKRVVRDRIVRATSSAAIADADTAGGRLVPLIMVDAAEHPEVTELIRVHQYTTAGDVTSQWATVLGKPDVVHLTLKFARPVVTTISVEFPLPELAGAIDNVLRAKSMYLLEGLEGSTFTSTQGQPRVLLELPSTGFETTWDRIFHKAITRMMREEGLSRRRAEHQAQAFVTHWRQLTSFDL
jgi:hypothetical protein